MLDFMIVAMPRSRTAWLANFLTTEKTFCFHDPLAEMSSYRQVLDLKSDRITGIADTSIGWFDLSIFDCKKIIIERDLEAVNASLSAMFGADVDMSGLSARMAHIEGLRIRFEDINDRLEEIWDYCTDLPFDKLRADHLKNMNVQVKELPLNTQRLESLKAEIRCLNS